MYKLIINKIQKATASYSWYWSLGLMSFKIAYLKNAANKLKSYSLFGKSMQYINGYDLYHSPEEIFIEEVFRIKLPAAPVVIDCNPNIGLSGLYFKRTCPDAKIIAF